MLKLLFESTGTDFEKVWRGLKGDLPSQKAYLHLLNPTALTPLFKTSLTGPLLASIISAALYNEVCLYTRVLNLPAHASKHCMAF